MFDSGLAGNLSARSNYSFQNNSIKYEDSPYFYQIFITGFFPLYRPLEIHAAIYDYTFCCPIFAYVMSIVLFASMSLSYEAILYVHVLAENLTRFQVSSHQNLHSNFLITQTFRYCWLYEEAPKSQSFLSKFYRHPPVKSIKKECLDCCKSYF